MRPKLRLCYEFDMARAPSQAGPEKIIELLQQMDGDPVQLNEMMETWNDLFEGDLGNRHTSFADVEAAAILSISSDPQVEDPSAVGRRVGHLLDQFESPAFLVRENGHVVTQNLSAAQRFDIKLGASLNELPFSLERDENIGNVIRASLNPQKNQNDAILIRAYSEDDDRPATLSIAPSKSSGEGAGEALVFVVDASWKTEAGGLIKREFDLTEAERALLEAFLDGQTTKDMAENRNRSHATIRTQFHSLMTKMRARSQTELFRNALSVSQFVDKIDDIAQVLRHPYRKRVDLVRPHGRSVEVTIAGDLRGTPIVFLQDAISYTFQSHIEKAFHDAGICVLSICRPGYGDTDPGPENEAVYETIAGDLEALLQQLGHDSCVLMSMHTSSAIMYRLSPYVDHMVTGLVQVGACTPIQYFYDAKTTVSWPKAIIRASEKSPALMKFMIQAGIRAWAKMGHKRFLQLQFRKSSEDLDLLLSPDAFRESSAAFETATKQGNRALTNDTFVIFSNFNDSVAATDLPILVLHGEKDSMFVVEGLRPFAKDHAPRCTTVILPDAGFSIFATHTDEVVREINAFLQQS